MKRVGLDKEFLLLLQGGSILLLNLDAIAYCLPIIFVLYIITFSFFVKGSGIPCLTLVQELLSAQSLLFQAQTFVLIWSSCWSEFCFFKK